MQTMTKEQKTQQPAKSLRVTGSEALLLSMVAEQVTTIFGYPGGAIMPVYDKLMDFEDSINHVLTRHEQGAVHAAQGYARATGKTGVCFVTSGPGATNLITGLADAMADSTPIVCITGQVSSPLLGSDAFQETDVVGVSMPVTKWNYQVTNPDEIAEAVAKAFYIASNGRPGPVLIDLTKDAMFKETDFVYKPCNYIRSYVPKPPVKEESVKAAAELIKQAKKPLVVFGQGVILGNAEDELKAFIEKSGIPAAGTLLGLSALPSEHPLFVGMPGMHGYAAPNMKTNECDLLIAIGMRFDDRVTGNVAKYAKQAKIIHLEIDKAEINKIIKVDVSVNGDVKESLPMLTRLIEKKSYPEWLAEFKACYQDEYKRVIEKEIHPTQEKLTMGEVLEILNEVSQGDAIFVTDVGQHQMMASRYLKLKNSRSLITSGGLGTMGFGLPTAMGAQMGMPHKQVVVIMGDGGFQMTIQELGTIMQNKLPVKMLLLNNNFLGMVRQWQELFFDERYSNTRMTNPDFVKLVSAYGIAGEKVDQRTILKAAIQRLWDSKEAYFLEVVVEKKGNVFPMVPTGAATNEMVFGDETK